MNLKITLNKKILFALLLLIGVTTLTQAQTTTQITSDNFEEGYGNWNNGGANSEIRDSGWSSCLNGSSGNKSVRLRNGNSSSKLTSDPYNFSNYSYVTITYNYATNDKMDNNEGWFIEYSDDNGSNWETIKQYRSGDNFTNNICVSDEEVTITPSSTINFNSSQILVRFRNNSNRNDEQLWLDNIVVKGIVDNRQDLFFEDFEDENQGDTSGTDLYGTDWNTNTPGDDPARFEVRDGNHFEVEDTNRDIAYWKTDIINISNYTDLELSADIIFSGGLETSGSDLDYIKFQYILNDNGILVDVPDAQFFGELADGNYSKPLTSITGNTIEIYISFLSTARNETHEIDNVRLKGNFTAIAPIANFSADNTTTFTGEVVTFTDESENNPASWAWSFSNPANITYVNGTSSTSQNPQVTFNTAGTYTVTLVATNSIDSDTITKIDYITVVTAIDNPASFTVNQSTNNPYTFLDLAATANADRDNILVAYNTTNNFGMPTRDANNNIILNGGGTIIFEGNANAVNSNTLPQLNQNTIYYFKAWSVSADSFSVGIEANGTTAAVEPPASFVVTASTINNSITFNAEANSLNDNLMLVYNTNNNFDTPEDGIFYQKDDTIGNATVLLTAVNVETINNYIHDLLQLDTRYYYRIYSIATGIWYYSQDDREDDDITIEGFIWQNNIEGDDPNRFNPFTNGDQVIDNITVSGISRGDGLVGVDDNNDYKARGWSMNSTLDISRNEYFEFTLTPDSGYEINFEEFFYNARDDNGSLDVTFRSSIDNYASNIGDRVLDGDVDTSFDLTGDEFQNISETITFRIYGWNATENDTEFKIEDFGFKGTLSEYATWNGTSWDKIPNLGMKAILNSDYNTKVGGEQTSFRSKSLKVNSGYTLTVDDNTFVEVNYDTFGEGNIVVETKGAFVQRNDGEFNLNGTSKVNKKTPFKNQWYYYTYWSSPVANLDINMPLGDIWSKFYLDAASLSWVRASSGIMTPGKGYIANSAVGLINGVHSVTFEGEFNTGDISIPVNYDVARGDENWNLIGNPYPSAIDLNQFFGANSDVIHGVAYFWSQETAPVNGQFSSADYIPFNATGTVNSSTDSERFINGFAPTGQSFIVISKASGNATFNNDIRMADVTSNAQFHKTSKNVPPKGLTNTDEKLWVNLTANNGTFSQVLVGYVDGATNEDDGLTYDAKKLYETGDFIYSTIENVSKKFVIQGKEAGSLNSNEIISLGFKKSSAQQVSYTISIDKFEGEFLSGNTVYLKDNLLNITHNLSEAEYSFTSEAGEFNDRFEIVFNNGTVLSINDVALNSNSLKIIQLENDDVQFITTENSNIKTITIYDLFGRQLYDLKGNNQRETYKLTNLSTAVYVVKVGLSNGAVITKKQLID